MNTDALLPFSVAVAIAGILYWACAGVKIKNLKSTLKKRDTEIADLKKDKASLQEGYEHMTHLYEAKCEELRSTIIGRHAEVMRPIISRTKEWN